MWSREEQALEGRYWDDLDRRDRLEMAIDVLAEGMLADKYAPSAEGMVLDALCNLESDYRIGNLVEKGEFRKIGEIVAAVVWKHCKDVAKDEAERLLAKSCNRCHGLGCSRCIEI